MRPLYKILISLTTLLLLLTGCGEAEPKPQRIGNPSITPIQHATAVISWDDQTVYLDPTGGADAFTKQAQPDIILLTDIHKENLSIDTIKAVITEKTIVIAPKAVAEKLPEGVAKNLITLNNGDGTLQNDFFIEATPMYNLPEKPNSKHQKGRGNGYLVEKSGKRMYISGDTEDIPEMRSLRGIDIVLIGMNLPETMSVDAAASAILDFAPKEVYPYNYRGTDGLSDTAKFKKLVETGNEEIRVIQLDWYQK